VCIAGTKEWFIEHDNTVNSERKWLFDGTNVYNSTRLTKPSSREINESLPRGLRFATVPFEQAKSNLSIRIWESSDGHPLGDVGVNIVWLAFCSGQYLKNEARLIPLPLADLRHTRDRYAYRDTTQTFDDELGLPKAVSLFTSKALLQASEDNFDMDAFFGDRYAEWKKQTVAELEENVLTFHYAVTESTNVLRCSIPTRFEFRQEPRPHSMSDWSWRGTGKLLSVRPASRPESLFVSDMQQTIVDYRFVDPATRVNAIIYQTTNTFALPKDDPGLEEKFAARKEQARRSKSTVPNEH
jgi:hypothetical protein